MARAAGECSGESHVVSRCSHIDPCNHRRDTSLYFGDHRHINTNGCGGRAKCSGHRQRYLRLEASKQSFRQEQRAYLWASSYNMANPPVCRIPGGPRICADVHIVNSGRTPAVGVRIHRYMTFGADAERIIKAMKVDPIRPRMEICSARLETVGNRCHGCC